MLAIQAIEKAYEILEAHKFNYCFEDLLDLAKFLLQNGWKPESK